MDNAQLREQILAAFLHTPKTSIAVCLRMSRGITAPHSKVFVCVQQLVEDGMLQRTLREGRLPPLFSVTRNAKMMLCEEEFIADKKSNKLKDHEQRALYDATTIEKKFAEDQETVIDFFVANGPLCVSTLMIQDCLRVSANDDNLKYAILVLSHLAWNSEVEPACGDLMWRLLRKKTNANHVWNLLLDDKEQ